MRTGKSGGGPWLPDIDLSIALAQAMHYEAQHRILMRFRRSGFSDAALGEPLTSRILARFRSALHWLALTRSAAMNCRALKPVRAGFTGWPAMLRAPKRLGPASGSTAAGP